MTRPRLAGWAYALCWSGGLLLVPGPPTAQPDTTQVRAYLDAHATAAAIQSSLVHGLAALCLWGVLRSVAQQLEALPGSRLLVPVGTGAVAVSLAQWLVMLGVWATTGRVGVQSTASMLSMIGFLDTAKLVLLGVFIGLTTRGQHRRTPGWFRWLSAFLAVLLPISGLAFVVPSSYLHGALYLSLPLLIGWVGSAPYQPFTSGGGAVLTSGCARPSRLPQ